MLMRVTSSNVVQFPFTMVHLITTVAPAATPEMVVDAEEADAIVADPLVMAHVPFPTEGVFPVIVNEGLLQIT